MKVFASSGYLLRYARPEVRLVYSAFLLLTMVGMLTMAAFEIVHIGPTPARVAAYFRGGEVGEEMAFPKTFRQLVEVTHFHSFVMGIEYLILAHLFVATAISPQIKRGLIILGFVGLAGDLVAPWLIRYAAAPFAYLLLLSWLAEWISFGAYIGVPIAEMWFAHGKREFPPE